MTYNLSTRIAPISLTLLAALSGACSYSEADYGADTAPASASGSATASGSGSAGDSWTAPDARLPPIACVRFADAWAEG